MKKILFIMLGVVGIVLVSSCEKSKDIIRDNVVSTGIGSYPVSTNALVDLATNRNLGTVNLSAGYAFKTELQFFSSDPVKEINLYSTVGSGSRTKIITTPYASAYSAIKKLDTLLVGYTIPVGLAVGTSIKLEFEILNQNTLSLVRPVTIRTQ